MDSFFTDRFLVDVTHFFVSFSTLEMWSINPGEEWNALNNKVSFFTHVTEPSFGFHIRGRDVCIGGTSWVTKSIHEHIFIENLFDLLNSSYIWKLSSRLKVVRDKGSSWSGKNT